MLSDVKFLPRRSESVATDAATATSGNEEGGPPSRPRNTKGKSKPKSVSVVIYRGCSWHICRRRRLSHSDDENSDDDDETQRGTPPRTERTRATPRRAAAVKKPTIIDKASESEDDADDAAVEGKASAPKSSSRGTAAKRRYGFISESNYALNHWHLRTRHASPADSIMDSSEDEEEVAESMLGNSDEWLI